MPNSMTITKRPDLPAEKCAEYGALAYARQAPQDVAQYQPLGGTGTQACANCLFFVSPNGCTVVEGWPLPISPTGLSRFWTAVPAQTPMEPMPVVIMGGDGGEEHGDDHDDDDKAMKAVWSAATINDLPDSSFAYIEPGGEKDEDGRTTPRSKRHFPFKDASGKVDLPHLRNALARAPQSPFGPKAMPKLEAAAEAAGIGGRGEDKGLWSTITKAVSEFFAGKGPLDASEPVEATGLRLYKDASGDLRWVAWVSNQFRDHDNPPEIIESKAHREFVAYLDKGGQMPEAWLWHTPGTRWGKADWADYADGFLLMSGTVDKGRERVAEKLMADSGGLGVSHGFRFEYADEKQGHIGWYRTFEISPLPREAAANPWTGLEVMKKEAGMAGFSAAKRAWLSDKLGPDEVARLEKDTAGLSKALQDAGIDMKEMPQDESPPPSASVKELTEALAPQFKEIGDQIAGFKAQTEQALASFDERLKAVERSDDEKVAETILKARIGAAGGGYRASQAEGTVLKEGDPLEQARPVIDPGFAASLKQ